MKEMNCEDVLIQKSALLDGETAELFEAEIAMHLAACDNCRHEIEAMQQTIFLLNRQERQPPEADLWSAVEKRIGTQSGFTAGRQAFVLVGVLLVVFKLVEMLPERDFGWSLKLVPFVLIAALFALLKENPFKINTELILEK